MHSDQKRCVRGRCASVQIKRDNHFDFPFDYFEFAFDYFEFEYAVDLQLLKSKRYNHFSKAEPNGVTNKQENNIAKQKTKNKQENNIATSPGVAKKLQTGKDK